MFEIILVADLAYKTSVKAKLKGANGVVWGLITVGAFMVGLVIGGLVVVFNFLGNSVNIDQFSSPDPKIRMAATTTLMEALNANPLHQLTIELFAIGGYLLIRYILDKKPEKKEPEVHWMDKMGNQ
jgi:hypothetical protein